MRDDHPRALGDVRVRLTVQEQDGTHVTFEVVGKPDVFECWGAAFRAAREAGGQHDPRAGCDREGVFRDAHTAKAQR